MVTEVPTTSLRVVSHAKSNEKQKKSQQNPPKDPLVHQIRFKTKEEGVGLPCVDFKNDLLVGAVKTKVNHVLGLPLTISTRRVEPTNSKATVLEEVSVLAKSRSEEEAKTRSHQEEFLKNNLSNSLEHASREK